MLKQYIWKRKILLALAILILLSISIISIKTNIVSGHIGSGFLKLPTNVPDTYQVNIDNTATPNATMRAQYLKTVYPTPTEIPISKYTDLSPSLNNQDIFIITVKHSDETYEQFTVGPLRSYTSLPRELPDYIITEIPLQPGDEIIGWLPPANPFRAMGTGLSTATQSIMIHPTEILPTPTPYPYP